MGIFYYRTEKTENGKKYLVLKSKPIPHYFFLLICAIMSVLYAQIKYHKISASSPYFVIAVVSYCVFGIMALISIIERREVTFDFFKLKKITKKGKSIFNYSNPQEIWIEK